MIEIGSILLASVYWLPFMVAAGRDHHRLAAIAVVNAALGWTGVGWLGVLGFALFSPAAEPRPPRRRHLRAL